MHILATGGIDLNSIAALIAAISGLLATIAGIVLQFRKKPTEDDLNRILAEMLREQMNEHDDTHDGNDG